MDARPDDCVGWDNWMVALPLPKDPTAQEVDSDKSLNRRRGGLLSSWFTMWLQGFTFIFFLFSNIKKSFIHYNGFWQVVSIYVANIYVLYVLGRSHCLRYVRGCACVLFFFLCVKPLECFFASCWPCGWNEIIKIKIEIKKSKKLTVDLWFCFHQWVQSNYLNWHLQNYQRNNFHEYLGICDKMWKLEGMKNKIFLTFELSVATVKSHSANSPTSSAIAVTPSSV